jgi:hypothetical protein
MLRSEWFYVDFTEKILGVSIKHYGNAVLVVVLYTYFVHSAFFPNSFLSLLAIPTLGYLTFNISRRIERLLPGTAGFYMQKWIFGYQIYYPGPDTLSAPLTLEDEE